jgi:hypothetical protein
MEVPVVRSNIQTAEMRTRHSQSQDIVVERQIESDKGYKSLQTIQMERNIHVSDQQADSPSASQYAKNAKAKSYSI